jgi:hypothetical protein
LPKGHSEFGNALLDLLRDNETSLAFDPALNDMDFCYPFSVDYENGLMSFSDDYDTNERTIPPTNNTTILKKQGLFATKSTACKRMRSDDYSLEPPLIQNKKAVGG